MPEHVHSPFISGHLWSVNRPHVLVVACSDGRLQRGVDEFLNQELGVSDYDRLYLPGGPGALASSGVEYIRSDRHRREFLFLLQAHEIETVVLLWHGAAADGPDLANCADYIRALNTMNRDLIVQTQNRDYQEIRNDLASSLYRLQVMGFRAEVTSDLRPRFSSLD